MTAATARKFDLQDDLMLIQSDLLGSHNVEPAQLFRFAKGLFGFPECHDFALLPAERAGLYWLQSVEHSTLTFLLVDPFLYFPGYEIDVADGDIRELAVEAEEDLSVLAIVTLPRTTVEKPTANLQGPVAFNLRTRLGKQLALEESELATRCPFDPAAPAA